MSRCQFAKAYIKKINIWQNDTRLHFQQTGVSIFLAHIGHNDLYKIIRKWRDLHNFLFISAFDWCLYSGKIFHCHYLQSPNHFINTMSAQEFLEKSETLWTKSNIFRNYMVTDSKNWENWRRSTYTRSILVLVMDMKSIIRIMLLSFPHYY